MPGISHVARMALLVALLAGEAAVAVQDVSRSLQAQLALDGGQALAATADAAVLSVRSAAPGAWSIAALACLVVPVLAVLALVFALGVAALVSPEALARHRTKPPGKDFLVGAACLLIPALTAYAMFGEVEGGGMEPRGWFGWHPVLMSASFPCLMVLGRMSSGSCAAEWMEGIDLQGRRRVHRALMIAAVMAMFAGYACIWLAHLPTRQFFGYDFLSQEWKPLKRIAHVWLGYGLLGLAVAQAFMGQAKVESTEGIYKFHGSLGKIILVAGIVEMFVAMWMWSWSPHMNASMAVLCFLALVGALAPADVKPDTQ